MVLDRIINGYHLTRVLMDGGSSLNLIYQDTVCKMVLDPIIDGYHLTRVLMDGGSNLNLI